MLKRGPLFDSSNGTAIHPKRRKAEGHDMKDDAESKSNDEYTVGWICALSTEYAAAIAFLDEKFDAPGYTLPNDNNDYTLGRIGGHNVVITVLPEYGTAAAAAVARDMMRSFPNTRIRLMVGIGGGAPTSKHDIRLGDVVVGVPRDARSGVLQYDFGKTIQNQEFQMTGFLNQPPKNLLAAITGLRTHYNSEGHRLEEAIKESLQRSPRLRDNFQRPNQTSDKLYKSDVIHPPNDDSSCGMACGDATSSVVLRPERPQEDKITIHYGLIASANQVMKDAVIRDRLASKNEVLCFEMEAAGLMNDDFSCLIIRGICDYSDSHKNKEWQGYAAMAAAAYAKDLIYRIRPIQTKPSHNIVDITTSASKTMKYQPLRVDQLEMILKSLRFDQIGARHMTIKNAHAKTCKWLLKNQQYLDWLDPGKLDSHHGFLWIKGKPGTGKSTLMKYALTYLRRRMKDQKIISFYFNARGGDMEKCTTGMYRSLLLQLLEQLPELQYLLQSLPIAGTSDDYVWNIQQLKCVFEEAIHNIKDATVLCFIDALDECDEDEIRDMISFFQNVGEFTTSNNIKFLVCFSSRHYPHISKENSLDLTLEGQEGHEQDIINYLDNELKIGQSRLAKQIRAEIREKAAGIFMWVFLVVEILNKEFDRGRIHELRQRLRDIPGDLHELFRDILTRDDHRKDELLLCIQWLLFSRQPLAPEEFYFAVLSGTLREGANSWDAEGISVEDMKKFILSSSKGLAEITKSKSPTVQFIHESVKDFLLKEDGLKDIYTDLGDGFVGRSHDRLKQCCLQYLNDNFVDLENCISLPTASSEQADHLRRFTKKEFPFIYYVVQNILHHANAAEMDQDKQTIFFQTLPFVTWITLSNLFEKFEIRRYTPKVTLLYVLAKYNAANLIRYHPSKLSCFEIGKERYGPPMFAALATNSNEAVAVFLEAHIQALSEEKSDSSLLCQLYEQYRLDKNKRQRIRQDFNFSSRRGILSHLAEHDDVTITYFWLNWAKTGVNFNSQDVVGKTPLFWAAEKGSNNMLNLLLRHGADVNIKSEFDGSPLIKAVDSRHETTVKLFLEAGADVDAKDRFDESPLHKAASYGHGAIAKLLLEAGADAMAKSSGGALPLHKSMRGVAIYGSEESYSVVTELLRKSAAEVNARDSLGETPLMYAAEYPTKFALNDTLKHIWRAAAVKLLLENGADANAKNRRGETPLYRAASRSDEKLVKLLLENGADVKPKDCSGRTALHVAAGLRYGGETVKLLLESGADIEAKEERGETPLHIAAESSYKEIVKLLLENGAKINAQTRTGETPLHKAAAHGGAELVELLVAHNASLRSNNKSGQKPLEIAQRRLATSSTRFLSSIKIEDMMRAIQLLETATKSEDVVISLL